MGCSAVRAFLVGFISLSTVIGGYSAQAATPSGPMLSFHVFMRTNVPLGEILWTDNAFIYDGESRQTLYTSNPDGSRFRVFATVPKNGGEMRCIPSPARYSFAGNVIFCHASGGQIYQVSEDGKTVTQFSAIPSAHGSDGGLTFDTFGMYGHVLLASTGGSDAGHGAVYAITANGKIRLVGDYAGPGGAERLSVAPRDFGPVSGEVLLPIDQHDHHGRLLAMDPRGRVRTLVTGLTWGLDPIVPLTAGLPTRSGGAAPGLYLADWESHDIFYAPAGDLQPFAGTIFLATERHGYMYVLRSTGKSYRLLRLSTNLHAPNYNMEGAVYISG
jgi:hypothetical protein